VSPGLRPAGFAITAVGAILALSTMRAFAAEPVLASDGIPISDFIRPLDGCAASCAGGDLPATGAAAAPVIGWIAAPLIAACLVQALWHRLRPAGAAWRFVRPWALYDVVNDRHAESSGAELASRPGWSAPFGDDAQREGERGESQCRRT
jgi:hypothetical protein